MKNIWTIMHRELVRVFKSPSMLIALLAPGVLIYVIYSVMGATSPSASEDRALAENYIFYAVNMPTLIQTIIYESPFEVEVRNVSEQVATQRLSLLETEEAHLVLVFDSDFVNSIELGEQPSFSIYFNPFSIVSDFALTLVFLPALNEFRDDIIYAETGISPGDMFTLTEIGRVYDLRRATGGILADFVPMMLLIFLFTGCMTITAESIAGEKERGTMATLLATPTKRRDIAIGKITSLSIISMISAFSSFLGIMLSLPQMIGIPVLSLYGFGEWMLVLLILISTVLFIVGTMTIISSFARNVKESTIWMSTFMFVGMAVSMLVMIFGIPTNPILYLIPLYNTSLALASVISFEMVILNLALTLVSNLVYTIGIAWLLARIFSSEKIMFAK